MKISLSIPEEFTVTNHGYGVISQAIVHSLQRCGFTVPFRDPTAQVELNIGQPYHWLWVNPDSYKIGLVAWESTEIPANWHQGLRSADEIWTPSPVIAKVFEDHGYSVKVYEHGVDSTIWTPKPRKRRDKIRFLHIGEPAPRKGGQLVYDVFKEVFGNSDEASLTIKGYTMSTVRGQNNRHPFKELNNVKVIVGDVPEWELVDLVHRHDVLVYPSYGEGFGLIPLQAMATGMPVICTGAWAPYGDLLLPQLRLPSKLADSPWPSIHPGQMWHPDREVLAAQMRFSVENFTRLSKQAFVRIPAIHQRYNWDALTRNAFAQITEKFS